MPIEARKQYLRAIIERYKKASRREKNIILNEFCEVCKYNRKYAILILNTDPKLTGKKLKPGRPSKYDEAFTVCLKEVWESTGRICSKKLKAAMPLWINFFDFSELNKTLLLNIGSSSIARVLKMHRIQKGISATRPSLFRHKVPIALIDGYVYDLDGRLQTDSVRGLPLNMFGNAEPATKSGGLTLPCGDAG